ncbi:MAG: hypothetical protein KTM48_00475, partial [Wolbachia endosymbiont of Pissodes strobi]|nr:hypothetical protein [Wolbachia endosymbiont of Pissodes strobi]
VNLKLFCNFGIVYKLMIILSYNVFHLYYQVIESEQNNILSFNLCPIKLMMPNSYFGVIITKY